MTDTLLNLSTIKELRELIGEDLPDIYQDFKNDMATMLDNIKKANLLQDMTSVTEISHTIKGSSGNIGLKSISLHAEELEKNTRLGIDCDIEQKINDIENAFNDTLAALNEMDLLP